MNAKLANELAQCVYWRSEAQRLQLEESIIEYWDTRYHGLATAVQIVTGFYPAAVCYGDNVEVHIGEYQTIINFG